MRSRFGIAAAVLSPIAGIVLTAPLASASIVASDAASNYGYPGGYNGSNGGFGFDPWTINQSSTGGSFINNVTTAPSAEVTVGYYFDLYENGSTPPTLSSATSNAIRPFASPLSAGETFSFSGYLNNANGTDSTGAATSSLGFDLQNASGTPLFTFAISGGGNGYSLNGVPETAIQYNYHETYTYSFELDDASGDYTFNVTGGSLAAGGVTLTGQIDVSSGTPSQFAVFNNDGGAGSDIDFSNLQIADVPEPASLALAGMAAPMLLGRPRRRQA